MDQKKTFKILSIDGGGIKGLYSALVLKHLEEEFCKKDGKCISDYFDMICGTSTGGIIALSLSVKTPASEIANFYKTRGQAIFPNNNIVKRCVGNLKQGVWSGKYNNTILKKELNRILGDKTMSDSKNLLCIPTFNLTQSRPTVWKYPHPEGNYIRDRDVSMVDAALSSSAAPTLFPIHEILPHGRFIDGGVWANNPTVCGVQEAIEFFVNKPLHSYSFTYNKLDVLSISSINQPTAHSFNDNLTKSLLGWNARLFNPFFEGQAHQTERFMTNTFPHLFPNSVYHRIPSPTLSPSQAKVISLDNANHKSLNLIESLGNTTGYDYCSSKRGIVAQFFLETKSYTIN